MRRILLKFCLLPLLILSLCAGVCLAETVKGDLSDRFSDIPSKEIDGVKYMLRNQMCIRDRSQARPMAKTSRAASARRTRRWRRG